MICPICGDQQDIHIEPEKPSYKDLPYETTYFAYKRVNHFKDHLTRIQAKETTKVPQIVLDIVLVEFAKKKYKNLCDLNHKMVRTFLGKYIHLGFNKYYENAQQIITRITKIPPLKIPKEIEEQLISMFNQFEQAFQEEFCPKTKANLISYPFILHEFCELLGYDEYLQYLALMKTGERIRDQRSIFKKIINKLGWKKVTK